MKKLFTKYAQLPRYERFMIIIAALLVLTLIASWVTREFVLNATDGPPLRVALVAPMSGERSEEGKSMEQGADLYIRHTNARGGVGGRALKLEVHDSAGDAAKAQATAAALAKDTGLLMVLGTGDSVVADGVDQVYAQAQLPVMVPGMIRQTPTQGVDGQFVLGLDLVQQTQFLANYALNVKGQRVVSIIADDSAYGQGIAQAFAETYEKFKVKTNYDWRFQRRAADLDQQLDAVVAQARAQVDTGAILLATDAVAAAKLVQRLRDAGARNQLLGLDSLATATFRAALTQEMQAHSQRKPNASPKLLADYLDGLLLTTPLVFDTANEVAQNLKNAYITRFGQEPDWMAAHTFEALSLSAHGLRSALAEQPKAQELDLRASLKARLAQTELKDQSGARKQLYFDGLGRARKPTNLGVYNGDIVISAPTQLHPIRDGGAKNYIEEFRKGRVLFVNDRFMYKTNVVYTGIRFNEISDVDAARQTVNLDLGIWFRFNGDFEPQNLTFQNAAEPIVLGEPVRQDVQDGMKYLLYHVKGRFFMNYQPGRTVYGQNLVGVSFSNTTLNKDNLQYVVDFLGLGLASGKTFGDSLNETRALNPSTGWMINKAWISQDISTRGTQGNPTYVGFGASSPEFSTVDAGIVIERNEFAIKNVVPSEYFVYLAIFGALGALFAIGLDRRKSQGLWTLHAWLMRVVSWPILVMAVGNLLLDFSVLNLSNYYTDMLALAYAIIWWIMPARLVGLAVERFVWRPLEAHTKRMVPNVVRAFGSILIYAIAIAGVTAFVFGETLTSLLATSGVLAMVVGLAIQANIANVFSGVILNIERPFQIGDFIRVNDVFGRVVNITWRTVRIESVDGPVVSLTNAQVSESKVENHANVPKGLRVEMSFHVSPDVAPEIVERIAAGILEAGDYVLGKGGKRPPYQVVFTGIESINGQWVASYTLIFRVANFLAKIQARGEFWLALRAKFMSMGIPLVPGKHEVVATLNAPAQAS